MKHIGYSPFSMLVAGSFFAAAMIPGCRLSDPPPARECYLSLQVDDSLYAFDRVVINLVDPSTQSVRKTVWDAPLETAAPLQHIASGDYCGEPVDLSITAMQTDSSRPYRRLVHFRGASEETVTEILPAIPAPKLLLFTTKDALVDTTSRVNNGLTAVFSIPTQRDSRKLFVFKFDLTQIDGKALKAGRLHFNIYASGSNLVSGTVPITCRIYGIHSGWSEGTGNWHYHRQGWRNGGDQLFANYFLSDSIKAISTDPGDTTGIDSSKKESLRLSTASLIATESVPLALPTLRASGVVPARESLADLSIDMTEYLKVVSPTLDFGWMITIDELPAGISLGTFSKEIGDGTLGPRLTLSY